MPMNKFASVELSYENDRRMDYQLFAEFLRLAGVYVYEYNKTVDSDKIAEIETDAECTGRYEILSEDLSEAADARAKLRVLHQKLRDVISQTALEECYEKLEEIFLKHGLLQAGVNLQYFRAITEHSDMKGVLEEAGDRFEAAADDLVAAIKENPVYENNCHMRYARMFCKQKANLAKYLCKQSVVYEVKELASESLLFLGDFPDFSNGWVLLGFIYEISKTYTRDAIDAFQRALKQEGEKKYMYSVYYWLGKRCEEYEFLEEETDEIYRKAHGYMPKYRNTYKLARSAYRKQDWQEALARFDECLGYLEGKDNYLDPLEQEYMFKVNIHKSYIYLEKKDYYNAILNANAALELREGIVAGESMPNQYTRFYFEMYGDEAGKMIGLAEKKMSSRQAYQYLARAYREIDMPKEADEYLKLAEQA